MASTAEGIPGPPQAPGGLVELRGGSFRNRGDELRVLAARLRLAPSHNLCLSAFECDAGTRRRLGLFRRRPLQRLPRANSVVPWLLPARLRHRWGLVADAEVRAVLDCSGFAYTAFWGPQSAERMARDAARWVAEGKVLILMPQGFGPFDEPRLRDAVTAIIEKATLVHARDPLSEQRVRELGSGSDRIRCAPDMSGVVEGRPVPGEDAEALSSQVCIVPNGRMIDMTPPDVSAAYVRLLAECIRSLRRRGHRSFLLLHADGDATLASAVAAASGEALRVVRRRCPLELKWIIGHSFAVIGSRFHALVSALSQGVPTLGTAWSFKYAPLFEEYGCPECLLPDHPEAQFLEERLDLLTDPGARSDLVHRLAYWGAAQRQRTERMWREIEGVLARADEVIQ